MKKVNKLLVIGLIILLIIIIILCIIIKKINNKPKYNNLKNEIKEDIKNNKNVNNYKSKLDDSLFDDSQTYERVTSNNDQSTENNYYYISNEGDVINYIDDVVEEATNVKEKSKLTKAFETLSDFIFYNGTIKGYTFDELTDSGKEKVMNAWYKLDSYIESKYPNYKSSLKDKYQETKEIVIEKYHEINTEENRQKVKDAYEEAKETAGQIKDKASPYVEEAKEEIKEGLGETKEDYKYLYQKFKEWLSSD